MTKNLIYISSSGFDSQVLNLLKEIEQSKFFNKIYLFVSEKNDNIWKNLLSKNEESNINIKRFREYPNYHFFKIIQIKALEKIIQNSLSDNTIIQIRGDSFSRIIKPIIKKLNYSNVKIISDIRGASYEEILLYSKMRLPFLQLKLYHLKNNLRLLRLNNDYISCVSHKLKEYVINKSKIGPSKVFVNHCIAGKEFQYSKKLRAVYRESLELEEKDILFLFVTGGNADWQNTDNIINSLANDGYKVLNLSKREISHKNVINMFVPYNEVHNYLNAADIGVIWRNNDIVNNVAAPIKFSEYTCSGLPVIANNGVDLINNYVASTGFGLIIKDFNDITPARIKRLIAIDRNEISSNAYKQFSLEVVSKRYIKIYNKILN